MANEEVTEDAQGWQGAVDGEFLMLRLDRLLEEYLRTLDAYQLAQQQLTRHLSSVRGSGSFSYCICVLM